MTRRRGVLVTITSAARRGAEVEGVAVAGGLAERGVPARAVALSSGGAHPLDVPVLGPSPLQRTTLRSLRALGRDHAVVVAYGSSTLPACSLALAGTRTPFVYRSIGDPARWVGGRAHRTRTGLLMRRASAVVALWPGAADQLRELYGLRRVVVIPNGRSPERFTPASETDRLAARRALGLPVAGPVVACVGALAAEKSLDVAVDAVARLPGTHLVVAGDGPERHRLHAAAAASLPGRCTFTGSLADVRPVFAAADAVLLTSRTEGMPGVLIEAGLSGLPAVATDVGAVSDVVADGVTGRVVPPGDGAAVAAALTEVLAAPQRYGAAARERCEQRFSLEAVLDQWEAFLTEWAGRAMGESAQAG